uniref:Uncharacterized protein n=1 Tax=Setaria italica TaxID=4555 RepID=K3YFK9_SETIT
MKYRPPLVVDSATRRTSRKRRGKRGRGPGALRPTHRLRCTRHLSFPAAPRGGGAPGTPAWRSSSSTAACLLTQRARHPGRDDAKRRRRGSNGLRPCRTAQMTRRTVVAGRKKAAAP